MCVFTHVTPSSTVQGLLLFSIRGHTRFLVAGQKTTTGVLARLWQDGTLFDAGGQQIHTAIFPPVYQPGSDPITSSEQGTPHTLTCACFSAEGEREVAKFRIEPNCSLRGERNQIGQALSERTS